MTAKPLRHPEPGQFALAVLCRLKIELIQQLRMNILSNSIILTRVKPLIKKLIHSPARVIRYIKIHLSGLSSTEPVFEKIYQENLWGNSESRSGPGSGIEQTRQLRNELSELIDELSAKSILDIPCGDFNWLKQANLDVDYIGADIVGDLVRANTQKFGSSNRRFLKLDLIQDELPQVDVLLCRDVLVHFTNRQIVRAIKNIKNSRSTYLLTTTFPAVDRNVDIVTGQWRPLDLCKKPFNFPMPLRLIVEHCTESNPLASSKCLALWRISDL
jgi:hypothetical protein